MEKEIAKTAIPAERQYAVKPGGQVSVCGIQTEAIAAYNAVKPFHPKRNARDAAEWVNTIKPAVVVPVHYGSIVGKMQDADVFKERVSDDIQVVTKITGE